MPSVIGGIYMLQHKIEGEYIDYNISLGFLTDSYKMKTIASSVIPGSIYSSADGSKTWCVSDNRPTYIEVSNGEANVKSSDIYVEASDAYLDHVKYYNSYLSNRFVTATSDASEAYFLDTYGTLWYLTADTLNSPVKIADNVFKVKNGSDGQIYVLKNPDYNDGNGYNDWPKCELYAINADHELTYQHSEVLDILSTKSNTYIAVKNSENEYDRYDLYYRDGKAYSLLKTGCECRDYGYWGGKDEIW